MKTETLDVAHRTVDETKSPANPALIGARWLATRISTYQRMREQERTLHWLKWTLNEIPTHLLEDLGIDEYQAAEIRAGTARADRIPFKVLLQARM